MGKEQGAAVDFLLKLSDEALMGLVGGGDQRAFEILIDRHNDKVRGMLMQMLKCPVDVDTVQSIVWMDVWRGAKAFKGDSKVSTWLYRVAWNGGAYFLRLKNRRLKHHPIVELTQKHTEIPTDYEPDYKSRSELHNVMEATSRLDRQSKDIFYCIANEMTAPEARAALNLSEACYKSRLYRLRQNLNRWRKRC